MSVFARLFNRRSNLPHPAFTTHEAVDQELNAQTDWVLRHEEGGGEHDQARRDLKHLGQFQAPLLAAHYELLVMGRRLEGYAQATEANLPEDDGAQLRAALDIAQNAVIEAADDVARAALDTIAGPRPADDLVGEITAALRTAQFHALHLEQLHTAARQSGLSCATVTSLQSAARTAQQTAQHLIVDKLPAPAA